MFYNYVYVDPSKPGKFQYNGINCCFLYEPFYVGKGTKNRLFAHLSNYHLYKSKTNPIKLNKFRKLSQLYDMRQYVIKTSTSHIEQDMLINERLLIESIGRKNKSSGPLTNADDGGTGSCGRKDSPQTIQNRSNSLKTAVWEYRRGKSYDDIYGARATDIKTAISKSLLSTWNQKGGQSDSVKQMLSTTRKGKLNPGSKIYTLTSPHNQQHTVEGGLKQFCIDHNLLFNTIFNNINNGIIQQSNRNRSKQIAKYNNTMGWSITRLT